MTSARWQRLATPVICLVTDRALVPVESLPAVVADAVQGGVNMVQLREKDLPTRDLLDLASKLHAVIDGRATLMINGRPDVAYAAGADGVHLPSDGLPVRGARLVLGPDFLIGRSAHHTSEVQNALDEGADYVELGTVFPSRSHPGGGMIGLQGVDEGARVGVPLLAIGGITAENAPMVMAAGAQGVAVISAILDSAEPGRAAERLAKAAREGYAARRAPEYAT